VIAAEHPGFDRSAGGRIEWGGKVVGHLGKIDPRICGKLDMRSVPAAAELELDPLLEGTQYVPQLRALPRFPAVQRDLSFVIPESTRFESLRRVIDQLQPANLEDVEFVGTYRGKPLEKGQKSVTISLRFRSENETLTNEAVDAAVGRVVEAAANIGAVLRR
jgi:phenylalanyl-tRNA synthetase beta chain